jgi:signal-transduction protein with cAMP-binding, CBS, and nucleotidyltransferase domain
VNDTDIIRNVLAKGINPLDVIVEDVMQTKIITLNPHQDMYDALQLMKKYNIRTLPVVEDGKLKGLLTLKDILKIQPTLFEVIAEKIELREESRKPINRIIEKEGICQLCGSYSEEVIEEDSALVCPKCRN